MNIESTEFGSITIDGEKHDHHIVIYPDNWGEKKVDNEGKARNQPQVH